MGRYLVAHDPWHVLQEPVECPELFARDGDDGPLEKLVGVDEESDFARFSLGNLDQRRPARCSWKKIIYNLKFKRTKFMCLRVGKMFCISQFFRRSK